MNNMNSNDTFELDRFLEAQQALYRQARVELATGKKRSHWMWFIFPQIAGPELTATAKQYAIRSVEEAKAYLAHPTLGPRLRECVSLVNGAIGKQLADLFSTPDDAKFHSSITLFAQAEGNNDSVFAKVLQRYFGGMPDADTLARLEA